MRFTLPLVIAVVIATPVGAWLSRYVPEHIVQWALVGFLLGIGGGFLFVPLLIGAGVAVVVALQLGACEWS